MNIMLLVKYNVGMLRILSCITKETLTEAHRFSNIVVHVYHEYLFHHRSLGVDKSL